ncbi:MAG: hypothetical protein J6W96_05575, partial [Alphaproteobacteria bacterium]|nr:hypothetical protein [Alphaproteobacteria bacterium]
QNIVDDETPGMPFDDDDPTVGYFDGDDYINARYEAPSGDEYEADGPTPVTEEVENIADYINAHRTDFELIYKTEMTQNILESFVKKGTTEPVDDDEMARIKKVLDLPPNASNRDIVNRLLEGDGLSDRQLCQLISKCCEFNEKLLERVLNLSAYQYGVLLRELNKSSDGIEITKDSVDNIIDVMQKVADEKVLNDLLLEGIYEDYDLDSEAAKTWFNESINSKFENKEEAISVLYAFSEIIGKEKDGEIKKWLKIDEDVEGQDLRKAVLDKLLSTDLSRDDILNKLKELDSRFGSPYTAEQIEELNKYGYSSKKLNFDELAEWCGDSKVATEYIVRCYEAPEVVGQKLGNHDKDPDKLVEDALVYFQNAERGVLPGQLRNNGDDRDPVTKIRELIKEISEVEYEPSNKSKSGNGIAGTDLSDGGTSADDLVLSEADDDNNNDNWFKRATKSVGKAIGDGWNGVKSAGIWVGKQVGNAGKWIGKQASNAGKWIGDKTTSVWNSVFKKKKKDNEAEGDAEVKTEKKQKKGNWFKRTVQNVQDLFGKKPDNAFEEWLTLQDAVRTAEKNGDEKEIAKAKKKLEHFERRTRNKAMIEAWKRVNDNLDLAKQNYAKGEDALDHLDELYANVYSASGWGAKNKAYNGDENNPGVEATVAQVSEYSQATITQACEASLNLAEFSEANKNASKKRKDGSDPLCEGTEGWNKYINAVNDAKKYKADKSEKMPTTDERKITQGDYAEETGKAIKGLVKIEAEKEIKSCEAAQAFAQNASETADGAWTELQKQRDAAVSANEEAQKKKTSKDAEAKEQAAKKAYDAAVAQKEIIEAKRNEINGQLTSLSALTVAEVAASRSKIQDMLNGLHTTEEVNAAVKAAEQAYNAAVKKKEELQKKEAEERTKELLQSWGIKELNAPKSRGGSIVQINGTPDLVYEAKYPTGNYNVCMKKGSTTVEEMTGATDTSLLSASVARESNGSEYGVCCKGLPDASGPYFGAIQMSVDNFKKMIRYFLRNHEKYSEECKKAMAMMFGCDLNNFEATLNAKGVEGMMDLLRTTDMTVKYGNRVHGCSSTMPAYQAIFVDHGTQTMQLQADFVTEELGPYYFNRYSINRSGKKVLSGGLSILVDRMKNDRAGGIRPEDINPAVWQLLVTAGIAYGNCDGAGAILSKVIDDSNLTKEEKLAKINSPEMLVEIYKRYPAIDEKAMKFALSRWNHKHSLATAWELSRMVGDKDKETYYRYVYNVYKPWARTHAYVENEQHSEDNLVADAAMAARLQDRSRS